MLSRLSYSSLLEISKHFIVEDQYLIKEIQDKI